MSNGGRRTDAAGPIKSRARSADALAYRKLYKTARWRALRLAQLRAHPLCAMCAARGVVEAATVADHVEPHRGDPQAFYGGALQSLCFACHDRDKQAAERRGFSGEVGADGWPVDPKHRANRS